MVVTIAYGALVLAGVCSLVRLIQGPTLADRVVALDVALISLMAAIAVAAAARGSEVALTLPIVIAIIGFTATIGAGRFIERERREDRDR